jgi:hypothetical protein
MKKISKNLKNKIITYEKLLVCNNHRNNNIGGKKNQIIRKRRKKKKVEKKEGNGKLDGERKVTLNECLNQKGKRGQWQCIAKLKEKLNP